MYFFSLLFRPPQSSSLFPYTTLFRSHFSSSLFKRFVLNTASNRFDFVRRRCPTTTFSKTLVCSNKLDRKSTRLNSSHVAISYAVFCLKKKKQIFYFKSL